MHSHLTITAPGVVCKVEQQDGSIVEVDSPAKLVDSEKRRSVAEPCAAP